MVYRLSAIYNLKEKLVECYYGWRYGSDPIELCQGLQSPPEPLIGSFDWKIRQVERDNTNWERNTLFGRLLARRKSKMYGELLRK